MSEALPAYARLPQRFAIEPLLAALNELPTEVWSAHFNGSFYDGDWSGVSLLGPAEAHGALVPAQGQSVRPSIPSRWHTPFWAALLAPIASPISSARLLRLGPGACIREHRDPDLGDPQGDVRLHIPILTHPAVEFVLDGQAIPMQPGEFWFLDLSRPHRVDNRSERARIHLVLDVARNAWLREQIAAGLADTPTVTSARSTRAFADFRARAHADPQLFARLARHSDAQAFAEEAVRLGAELGLDFSLDDVRSAMRAGRNSWSAQWKA